MSEANGGINRRVRAILLSRGGCLLLVKRVRPGGEPYYVTPGGGVEATDRSAEDAVRREVREEIGAEVALVGEALRLQHSTEGRTTHETYFVCRLQHIDLGAKRGPEFDDEARGQYFLEELPLMPSVLTELPIRPDELKTYLMSHYSDLFALASAVC